MNRILSFTRFGPAFARPATETAHSLDIPLPPLFGAPACPPALSRACVCCSRCASWTACWAAERCGLGRANT
jgi:hypothetical protein